MECQETTLEKRRTKTMGRAIRRSTKDPQTGIILLPDCCQTVVRLLSDYGKVSDYGKAFIGLSSDCHPTDLLITCDQNSYLILSTFD